jgi:hypothetical protein
LYLDAIGELCAAGGIAVLSAGNGEAVNLWHIMHVTYFLH